MITIYLMIFTAAINSNPMNIVKAYDSMPLCLANLDIQTIHHAESGDKILRAECVKKVYNEEKLEKVLEDEKEDV